MMGRFYVESHVLKRTNHVLSNFLCSIDRREIEITGEVVRLGTAWPSLRSNKKNSISGPVFMTKPRFAAS